jgi:ATP-binding cassette subfamily B protein
MNSELTPLLWPASRLGDALLSITQTTTKKLPTPQWDPDWLEAAARSLGLEAQPVEIPYADFERHLPKIGPAILHVPAKAGDAFLVILPGLIVLTSNRERIRIAPSAVREALCAEMEAPAVKEIQETLDRAGIPRAKQARACSAILRERFSTRRIRGIWILRLPPSANFWQQLREVRVPQRLALLGSAHALQYALWILAWFVVGRNVLNGGTDRSWLLPWALLLLTLVPLRVLITWLQGLLAFGAGARLKQRLFFGALRLEPDSIRHQGAGQLLGRVLESEAVEALALSGGLLAMVAIIEIVFAIFVLGAGAGGALHSTLLLAWLAVAAFIAWHYFQRNRTWTSVRLDMTHDLVESMVGHRTRLAQRPPDRWHAGEDEALEQYLKVSKRMDDSTVALLAIVPRGWLVLGLLGLAPAFVRGDTSAARIAIAVGGMLLAYRALRRLVSGAWQLTGAAIAWQRVSVLYRAATRPDAIGSLDIHKRETSLLVDARDLVFRYRERADPVLNGCSLRISAGDRLVLEGPSGGGKSTLVALLAGLREPTSGRLLMDGFDRQTLGFEAWRRRIAAAPQFHENHVLAETFAFNLFMGKRKALAPADFEEAETICQELGLGGLLSRMPAGMLQMVGETGWQLSHGERSRLYIARALLQDAELVVLDESFAALDPENLQRALECVLKRAKSLLVIAHQ